MAAVVLAPPVPAIGPPDAMPSSYRQHFAIAANDIYEGNYIDVMHAFRTGGVLLDGDALLVAVGSADAAHPNCYIGCFEHGGAEGGRSLLISGIQHYAILLGRPSQWDQMTFGFAGDVVQGEIPTVQIHDTAFNLTRGNTATTVPNTAERIDELWAQAPLNVELLASLDAAFEPDTRQA
jgi:hypothetical protein